MKRSGKREQKSINQILIYIIIIILALVIIAGVYKSITGKVITNPGCTSGVVGYWPLNGSAIDLGGNNGYEHNINWVAGKLAGAASFNGVNSYININSILNNQPLWTWTAWVNMPSQNINYIPIIYSEGAAALTFKITLGIDGRIYISIFNINNPPNYWINIVSSASSVVPLNTWSFIAITLKDGGAGVKTLTFYINGVLVSEATAQIESNSGAVYAAIGISIANVSASPTEPAYPFKGSIDEMAIFNRALTGDEISDLYNSGAGKRVCTSAPSCTDSDGGKNYNVKGFVSGISGMLPSLNQLLTNVPDVCYDTLIKQQVYSCSAGSNCLLAEYYCGTDGKIYQDNYVCPYGCSNGTCNSASQCTPNIITHQDICRINDRKVTYYTDANNCPNPVPPVPENISEHCDYNNNNVIGSFSNIDTEYIDVTSYVAGVLGNNSKIYTGTRRVEFKNELGDSVVKFDWNFANKLDLDNIYIERQSPDDTRGYLLIKGISASKTLKVDRLTDSNRICVKNSNIDSITEITSDCDGSSETEMICPDEEGSISCNVTGNYFSVSGLTNSAVVEMPSSGSSCVPFWSCGNFSDCVNGMQTRTCTDLYNCNTAVGKPVLSQSCGGGTTHQTHLVCQNNECTSIGGSGTNECSPVGSTCGVNPPTCNPSWDCTDWSTCSNSQQTRTCTDSNNCNTDRNKPDETQICTVKSNLPITITIIVLIIIIIIVVIAIIYLTKKKKKANIPQRIGFPQQFSRPQFPR